MAINATPEASSPLLSEKEFFNSTLFFVAHGGIPIIGTLLLLFFLGLSGSHVCNRMPIFSTFLSLFHWGMVL